MQIGRYKVVALLGHGGFGEVFRARLEGPMGFTRDVAIKRVHPHLVRGNPSVVQALIDEARLGGLLRHPNIVESHEFERDEESWFLTMEFVEGVPLDELNRRNASAGLVLPAPVALHLVEQACRGLDYAHQLRDEHGEPMGIVHRDLKPANLMLSSNGVLKVMDFGIAKATSNLRDSTATGMLKGTPSYMSPEQVRGSREITSASDLYALGVILYELVTGGRLFDEESPVAVMFAVIQGVPEGAAERLEALVPGLGPIFTRTTQLEPDQRYGSCGELARALARLREDMEDGSDASRVVGAALLRGPASVGPEELDTLSQSLRSYVAAISVETLATEMGELDLSAPEGGDQATDTWAGGADQLDGDATRTWGGAAEPLPVQLAPEVEANSTWSGTAELASVEEPPAEESPAALEPAPETTLEPARRSALLWPGAGAALLLLAGLGLWAAVGDPQPDAAEDPSAAEPASIPALAEPEPPENTTPEPEPAEPTLADGEPQLAEEPPAEAVEVGAPRPAERQAEPPKAPAQSAPVVAEPVAEPAGQGTLLVRASPWGRVLVDGKEVGKTPLRIEVASGPHAVEVACGECAEPSLKRFDVVVSADAVESVKAEFAP